MQPDDPVSPLVSQEIELMGAIRDYRAEMEERDRIRREFKRARAEWFRERRRGRL